MPLDKSTLSNIPNNTYLILPKGRDSEDHIIKKRFDTGFRIMADKCVKIPSYTKEGMEGSRNFNFQKFLTLGMIPNFIGSAMLITISNALNGSFGGKDSFFAAKNGRKMAAGVILYALGKWIGNKIINKGVEATTGIDLDMPYKKIIHELPDGKDNKAKTSIEFHKVFESSAFPRWDLINKKGEENGNRYEYYDKLAKRMGYKEELNAPDQVVQPKVREVIVKATAAKSLSPFIWAAVGCGIAAQEPVGGFMKFRNRVTFGEAAKALPGEILRVGKESVKSFAKTKTGKVLMVGAVLSSVLGIANSVSGFKADKPLKSTIDDTRAHQEF